MVKSKNPNLKTGGLALAAASLSGDLLKKLLQHVITVGVSTDFILKVHIIVLFVNMFIKFLFNIRISLESSMTFRVT